MHSPKAHIMTYRPSTGIFYISRHIMALIRNGALTLCRVGLPSTCRAIKKQQSPERWVLSELVPGRKKNS